MVTLTNLSDSVILEIFQFLPHKDLLSLSKTCAKFEALLFGLKTLWINVDYTDYPLKLMETRTMMKYLHQGTVRLALEGLPFTFSVGGPVNISETMIKRIRSKCPNLKVLQLQGFLLHRAVLDVSFFPRSLTTLVIKGCSLKGLRHNFHGFQDTDLHMPFLEKIEFDGSRQIGRMPIFCLAYFKDLPKLKELIVRNVYLAEYFPEDGFQALKKLDMIDTDIYVGITNWNVPPVNLLGRLKDLSVSMPVRNDFLNFWFGRFDASGSSIEKLAIKSSSFDPRMSGKSLEYISKGCPNLKRLELMGAWKVDGKEIEDFQKELRYTDEENNTVKVVIHV